MYAATLELASTSSLQPASPETRAGLQHVISFVSRQYEKTEYTLLRGMES